MMAADVQRGVAGHRAHRCAAAVLATGLLTASLNARSELVEIAWKDGDRFDRTLTVAPGKFAELCGALGAGKTVTWVFDADGELNFNIHFHLGKEVHYPVRTDRVRHSAGELAVDLAQDYCWMWTNKSAAATRLAVRLTLK